MQRVIGGEFDIDISNIGTTDQLHGKQLYSSGRAALYHILKLLSEDSKFTDVLLPDYLCESVLDAVRKSGFLFSFYKINADLSVDFESLKNNYSENSVVLLINYFGSIDIENQIRNVRHIDKQACVIADNVQGFYDMSRSVSADFSFTSFRKIFPVPDGAWVETPHVGLEQATQKNTFAASKIVGGLLKNAAKHHAIDDALYLSYFDTGEHEIDQNYDAAPSEFSKLIFGNLDLNEIATTRRQNAKYVASGLLEIGIDPIISLSENAVPLFVPIRLSDRDAIRRKMFSENIFCPVHWPSPNGISLLRADEMAKTELSLIVDQRYDLDDMQRMLDVLKKHL